MALRPSAYLQSLSRQLAPHVGGWESQSTVNQTYIYLILIQLYALYYKMIAPRNWSTRVQTLVGAAFAAGLPRLVSQHFIRKRVDVPVAALAGTTVLSAGACVRDGDVNVLQDDKQR